MIVEKEELLTLKEGHYVEFKSAQHGLPQNIFETISSFSNSDGGTIYLGIVEGDIKILQGFSKATCEKYKLDLLNSIHNKNKISFPVISDNDFTFISLDNDKYILSIEVKEAHYLHKPIYLNNNLLLAYGRDNEGDYLLRGDQIKTLFEDSGHGLFDSLPNKMFYGFDDVDLDTLHTYRDMLNENDSTNLYKKYNDEEFLKKTAFLIPGNNGKHVLSNAGVLLFTSSSLIKTICPHYYLDYQSKESAGSKWKNRISSDDTNWSGNVFDFYLKTFNEICQQLPSSYVSDGGRNIGPRLMQDAIKEALANALSNHAFLLNGSLTVYRYSNGIEINNNGKMLVPLELTLRGGISLPRNSMILTAFRRLGIADRAGKGIPKKMEALKENHFPDLIIKESSYPIDKTTIVISFISLNANKESNNREIVLSLLAKNNNGLSILDFLSLTNWSRSTISKLLNALLKEGFITTNGKAKKARRFLIK